MCTLLTKIVTHAPPCLDAHKALELLEEYRRKLSGTDNEELREALSKAIVAIRSRLFQALLGKNVVLVCSY